MPEKKKKTILSYKNIGRNPIVDCERKRKQTKITKIKITKMKITKIDKG